MSIENFVSESGAELADSDAIAEKITLAVQRNRSVSSATSASASDAQSDSVATATHSDASDTSQSAQTDTATQLRSYVTEMHAQSDSADAQTRSSALYAGPALADQTLTARAHLEHVYALGVDRVHESIRDERERELFVSATSATVDASESIARSVNKKYVENLYAGADNSELREFIKNGGWDIVRGRIYKARFDENADENAVTDVRFFDAVREHIAQKKEREALHNEILDGVYTRVLKSRSGDVDALQIFNDVRNEYIEKNGVKFGAAETDFLREQAQRVATDTREQLADIHDDVEMVLQVLARDRESGEVGDTYAAFGVDSVIDMLAGYDDKKRRMIYNVLSLRAEDADETADARARGWIDKTYTKTWRQIRDIATSHIESFRQSDIADRVRAARVFTEKKPENLRGFYKKYWDALGTDERRARFISDAARDEKRYRVALEIKSLGDNEISPARFENKWLDALAAAPGQVAYMSQAALGPIAGTLLLMNTTKALRTQELVLKGMSVAEAERIATISAVPEAMIERLQFGMWVGKGSAAKLIGNVVKEQSGKEIAKRAGVVFGTELVMQNVQETLQDMSPLAVQHVASWLDTKVPATTVDDWLDVVKHAPETAMTLLPLVILGTGSGAWRDRQFARQHMANEQAWRALGFREEQVAEITELVQRDELKAASKLVQQYWNDASVRNASMAEARAALEEMAQAVQEAGAELADYDIEVREDKTYVVRDRNGEVVDVAATPEAAIELARQVWERERAREEKAQEQADAEAARAVPEVSGFEAENVLEGEGTERVDGQDAQALERERWAREAQQKRAEEDRQREWQREWNAEWSLEQKEKRDAEREKREAEARERDYYERARKSYPEEARYAEENPREVSDAEISELSNRRQRAFEVLDKRARAVEATNSEKAKREYQVALEQSEKLDSEYAKLWFQYENQRRKVWAEGADALSRKTNNPFHGERRVTLPDNARKSTWTQERVEAEQQRIEAEREAQERSDSVEADVGGGVELSAQASDMLDRTQRRGVLGMPEKAAGEAATESVSIAEAKQRIAEVIEAAKQKGNPHKRATIGTVRGWVAHALTDLLGVDATGYLHVIDTDAVRHIRSEHGDAQVEKSRGQVGITETDLLSISEVINNPDKVSRSESEGNGPKAIVYEKQMPDGTIVYVESVSDRRKRLLAKTMYKKSPRLLPTGDDSSGNRTRPPNVRNGEAQDGSTANSAQLGSPVKGAANEGRGQNANKPQSNLLDSALTGEAAAVAQKLGRRRAPVSAPEVMDAIAQVVTAVGRSAKAMNRVGRMGRAGRKYAGFFQSHGYVTRIKRANDAGTAAHEVGHALDHAMWGPYTHWEANTLGLTTHERGELYRLGKARYGNVKPHNGYHSEGFAEFVRLWIHDKAQAQERAPLFSQWWEGELSKRPELAKALAVAQGTAHAHNALSAAEKVRANRAKPVHPLARAWHELKETNLAHWFEDKILEKGGPIRRFSRDAAKALGKKQLDSTIDPYFTLGARRMTADALVDYMANHSMINFAGERTEVAPLAEAFAMVRDEVEGRAAKEEAVERFVDYLYAKRSVALWTDPRGARAPGISLADALATVAELETPTFIRASGIVYAWNNGVLDYVAGMSPSLAEMVRRMREVDPGFYIPLQREFEAYDKANRGGGGSSAARAQLTKRLKGSGRRIKDPVNSMLAQAKDMILKAHQRKVIDQVMTLARGVEGLGHYVVEVPVDQLPAAQAEVAELLAKVERAVGTGGLLRDVVKLAGDTDGLGQIATFFAPSHNPKQGETPTFPVWEQGRMRWYEVDPSLYEALSGMDSYRLDNVLWKILTIPAQALRLGTTGLRASFSLVTNAQRDFSVLHMNSSAGGNSLDMAKTWLGVQKDALLYAITNGKVSDEYIDLARRIGLEMAQPLGQDSQPLNRAARRVKNGGKFDLLHAGDIYDFLKDVLQFTELGSRVTEIKMIAKEIGWDPSMPLTEDVMMKLMLAGKQVTTDFTQAGAYVRVLNQVIPFLNANIQGPVAHYRAAKRDPIRFMLRGLQHTALSLANWYRNRDEDWWKEMSAEERYRFTYIPLPDGSLLRIARAFEADGLFMAGAEALLDAAYAQNPKAVKAWFGQWLGSFKPEMIPAAVKPAIEVAANQDFFRGRPIESKGLENLPVTERYNAYTSRVAMTLSKVFNSAGAPLSPVQLDHLIRGHFGGVGADLVGVLGRGNSNLIKREWETACRSVVVDPTGLEPVTFSMSRRRSNQLS